MKILVDMNLSPLWVAFLLEHGYLAVHWSSIGAATAPDSEILEYAVDNGFVVLTHDLDFGALLAARKAPGPSVIQIRAQDVLPAAIGESVIRAVNALRAQLEQGAIITLDILNRRVRLLPIG